MDANPPVTEPKGNLLIVEDDLDVADMLNAYFRAQGYEVSTVNWGEDAIQFCAASLPQLVILDIRLPDIDGFEVAQRLRANRRTRDIPIIFLTEKRARKDRLHGLELGADDYITKPFDVQELRLRVRNALRRSSPSSLTNRVTNLPEGPLVDEQLLEAGKTPNYAVLTILVDHLDFFRETYGFVASDDVLRAASLIIQNAARENKLTDAFLGQLCSTGFILITTTEALPALLEMIRSRLEGSLDYFYPLKDLGSGGDQRLAFRFQIFTASEGPIAGVDALKKYLRVV